MTAVNPPRILLIGKNGQVGSELELLLARASELLAVGRAELDLTRPPQIRTIIARFHPQIIINAAAYTAVDKAESDQAAARMINAEAPALLAEQAKKIGAALIDYSTDYVFDGTARTRYLETSETNPLNVYGWTKREGEKGIQASGAAHLIFRTEWVYATRGKNFLLTILRIAQEQEELRIVADQIGAPTWSRAIARATTQVLTAELRRGAQNIPFANSGGIYHLTAAGETTWQGFASAILDEIRSSPVLAAPIAAALARRPLLVKKITPIATTDFPTPARRPRYSLLSNEKVAKAFGVEMRNWREDLREALQSDSGAPGTAI